MRRRKVNSKKTTVDGITFLSKLESVMYQLLRDEGIESEYEGISYIVLKEDTYPEFCLERVRKNSSEMKDKRKVAKIQYTPDFVDPNEKWIIECKGYANESFSLRWKLFKHMMMQRKDPPMIFKPTTKADCEQVVKFLKTLGYGRKDTK